ERSTPHAIPGRAPRLPDHGERHATFRREPAQRGGDIVPLELHHLRPHGLRELDVLDEPALQRGVDLIGPLLRSLDVHAVPVGVQTTGDATRPSEQYSREWRVARQACHDPVDGLGRMGRAAVRLAKYDAL